MKPYSPDQTRFNFGLKRFTFFFALTLWTLPELLVAKPRVALLNLQGEENISASQLEYLSAVFRVALIRSEGSEVVPAKESETARFQYPDQKAFFDSESASSIGKSAAADYLLSGFVFQENEKLRIMILLYRVETGEVLSKEEILLGVPLADDKIERTFSKIVGALSMVLGVPVKKEQPISSYAKKRAFQMGLIYPGLGHFSANKYFTGSLYFALFSASLYNALYLTPQGNQRERHKIFKDARTYGLAALSLPTPTSRAALFESGLAGYLMARDIRDRRHDAPVRAAEKTITSILLLGTTYLLTIADLGVRLDFSPPLGPGTKIVKYEELIRPTGQSYGITFTYKF